MASVQFWILQGRHFVVDGPKTFKLSPDISFDTGFQKIVLSSLLLFLCACYKSWSRWYEVATLTARNFNSSGLLYFHFLNMINLCLNIWFIKILKCQQFLFWRKSRQKAQILNFFKGLLFRNGVFWETSVAFLKSLVLQLFLKYSQSYANLNVKSRPKWSSL